MCGVTYCSYFCINYISQKLSKKDSQLYFLQQTEGTNNNVIDPCRKKQLGFVVMMDGTDSDNMCCWLVGFAVFWFLLTCSVFLSIWIPIFSFLSYISFVCVKTLTHRLSEGSTCHLCILLQILYPQVLVFMVACCCALSMQQLLRNEGDTMFNGICVYLFCVKGYCFFMFLLFFLLLFIFS